MVIVWKSLTKSNEPSGNAGLRMHGTGWMVIEKIDASTTRTQHLTRLVPESQTQLGARTIEDAQQDVRVNTVVDLMLLVAEAFVKVLSQLMQS